MPSTLGQTSAASRTALVYTTLGALITAWSLVGWFYLHSHPPEHSGLHYLGAGVLGTGLVLLIIGLSIGRIGRAARRVELPPAEATPPQAPR